MERAAEKLSAPPEVDDRLDERLQQAEAETKRIAEAIALAGEMSSLLAVLKEREEQVRALKAAKASKRERPRVSDDLQQELRQISKEWRAVLRARNERGRATLGHLIQGRLTVNPLQNEIEISGKGTVEPVIAGRLPQNLASPMPDSWNQIASWLAQIDKLRQAA